MEYTIIILCILFSAFFSGIEIAFLTANKFRLKLGQKKMELSARLMSRFSNAPSRFIGTMLVGNNISLVIYGIFMAKVLEPTLRLVTSNEPIVFISQTLLSTLLILVTAEFLPKAIFRIDPDRLLSLFSWPVIIIYYILWVPTIIITGITEILLRFSLNANFSPAPVYFGKVDLDHYVREMSDGRKGDDIDYEIKIFRNALAFSKVKVRECMVPRTDIISMDIESPLSKLREKFSTTGMSRILIRKDTIDNIIGYTHSYELFKSPGSIQSILLPLLILPPTMLASEALEQFIKERRSIALVVDEFGGTEGMLTIEDVMEEIFGEIQDEHDMPVLIEKQLSHTEYEFSARLEVDHINEKYQLDLPVSESYETLSGLILHLSEDIPYENEIIENEKHIFEIIKVSNNRIELVKVKVREI